MRPGGDYMDMDKTVWRLTSEDFILTLEGMDIDLSESQIEALLANAQSKFHIHDWEDYVKAYIDYYLDSMK